MRDSVTGRSRGFGFVTFADGSSADKVLSSGPLELDGRTMDAKPAVPKESMNSQRGSGPVTNARTAKLFVGGLSPDTQQSDFQEYFAQFGTVSDAIIMMDSNTGRPRGFGFVTFDSEDTADRCMAQSSHIISNKQVECKRAVPKSAAPRPRYQQGFGGRGGGGHGGYGGPPGPYGAPQGYGYGGYGGYGYGYPGYAPPPPAQGYGAPAGGEDYGGRGGGGYGQYQPPAADYGAAPGGGSAYGAYSRNSRTDRSYHPYSR